MKCDSWASFLTRTFTSLCFGRKLKAMVATFCITILNRIIPIVKFFKLYKSKHSETHPIFLVCNDIFSKNCHHVSLPISLGLKQNVHLELWLAPSFSTTPSIICL
jgi:hypothetical protein